MKNKIYILLVSLLALWSCNDYEDLPVEKHTLEYVFSKTDSLGVDARRYLNNVYSVLQYGHNRVDGDYLDAASDDAISASISESDAYKLAIGRYTASVRIGSDMRWGKYYEGIRRANTFINNIDVVPFIEKVTNHADTDFPIARTLKAEARFLKAYYYFELVKRYGGIPLVGDIPYELGEPMELPRNTFEECIEYIVNELDAIKDSLRSVPMSGSLMNSYGHVPTAGSAMGLKVKVLLYAASPLFNGSPIEANNPLIGYTDYKADRWERAAKAASEFITEWGPEGRGSYGLIEDFRDVFLGYYEADHNEVIFHVQGGNESYAVERTNGPVGFTIPNAQGNGATSPTQNLVDAFPMLDGKTREDKDGKYSYNIRTMYDNRDPRLDYTVLHNGSKWLSTILQTYIGGKNNPSVASQQKTKTSYYMRKFMGKFEDTNIYANVTRNWIVLRYADILLSYAEAQNEYELETKGENASANPDVIKVIRDIRKRAGIEDNGGTFGIENDINCKDMQELIRNERRVEMAFEEQRYWDIRRWKIAEEVFSKPLQGLTLIMRAGNLEAPIPTDVEDVKFDVRRYLYPIPYTEVNKNSNMVQNPKW